jgi:hypothetical protein
MSDYGENPETEHDFIQECYKINGCAERVKLLDEGQEPCYTSGGD